MLNKIQINIYICDKYLIGIEKIVYRRYSEYISNSKSGI